jgi:hypothetical protein
MIYRGFGFNGFMTKVQPFLIDGYYRTDIISDVGHPRSDSVVSLVLCMVACNGWGTGIVLQIPPEHQPCFEGVKISSKLYMKVMTYKALAFSCIKIFR